jgi:hypothetical protein
LHRARFTTAVMRCATEALERGGSKRKLSIMLAAAAASTASSASSPDSSRGGGAVYEMSKVGSDEHPCVADRHLADFNSTRTYLGGPVALPVLPRLLPQPLLLPALSVSVVKMD